MVNRLILKSKKIVTGPQSSIFSAATIIMIMVLASKFLGFVRQRTLFTYFSPADTDLFLAAFELPDLIFEVFVYGILSAAFIPVFSKYLSRGKEKEAWHVAVSSLNLLLVVFGLFALLVFVFAGPLYSLITGGFVKGVVGADGGFTKDQVAIVVSISRLLLVAQLFFVISSFLTGVLESFKRFLIPALAPLLYNLGIIFGIVFLSPTLGIYGPAVGVLIGALAHLVVQLPLARHLGFRMKFVLDLRHPGVKKMIKLSIPRVIELAFLQLRRVAWLFLASLFVGGFTYLKSADMIQAFPVGVFGLSLAKAAFPTLSQQAGTKDMEGFRKTFVSTLNQIFFLVIPFTAFMVVLRIPVVRLVFGTQQFDWNSTVQTGYALSAFAVGIFAYAGSLLVSRSFYALQDTKTPVIFSILSVVVNVILAFVLVLGFGTGTWGIALSYSVAGILLFIPIISILIRRIKLNSLEIAIPFAKMLAASGFASILMFLILKIFDRSVWIKRLSFMGSIESAKIIPFETFVLDTRFTVNLLILTIVVVLVGSVAYVGASIALGTREVWTTFGFIRRILVKQKIAPIPKDESEIVSPPHSDTGSV